MDLKVVAQVCLPILFGVIMAGYMKVLDSMLNRLEQPLKARFFAGHHKERVVTNLLKIGGGSRPYHLSLTIREKSYAIKITSVLEMVDPFTRPELFLGSDLKTPYLHIRFPIGLEEYKKTWGGCDLILCVGDDLANNKTYLYWLNAPQLLLFLESLKKPVEVPILAKDGTVSSRVYDKKRLAMGMPIEDLRGYYVIEQVDEIDWALSAIIETETSFFPMRKPVIDFSFGWMKPSEKAHEEKLRLFLQTHQWGQFPLMMRGDASKKIALQFENGDIEKFVSIRDAADYLGVCAASVRGLLHGRTKMLKKSKRGRVTAAKELV